jgi:REP element-mobilizing transposase RayT
MPRKNRSALESGIHHVFARGNNRAAIFVDDVDRAVYLRLLADAVKRQSWRCLAYCLMPNHVHLLIEADPPALSAGMCKLHGDYAKAFNRRHGRRGHLFGERFGSVYVEDDAQLWMVAGYVAR